MAMTNTAMHLMMIRVAIVRAFTAIWRQEAGPSVDVDGPALRGQSHWFASCGSTHGKAMVPSGPSWRVASVRATNVPAKTRKPPTMLSKLMGRITRARRIWPHQKCIWTQWRNQTNRTIPMTMKRRPKPTKDTVLKTVGLGRFLMRSKAPAYASSETMRLIATFGSPIPPLVQDASSVPKRSIMDGTPIVKQDCEICHARQRGRRPRCVRRAAGIPDVNAGRGLCRGTALAPSKGTVIYSRAALQVRQVPHAASPRPRFSLENSSPFR